MCDNERPSDPFHAQPMTPAHGYDHDWLDQFRLLRKHPSTGERMPELGDPTLEPAPLAHTNNPDV